MLILDKDFSLHLVTPSDMGVCNTSQVCIPRHLIYGQTGRFLHVRPKLARIFLLKSYLFKGSFWRCLQVLGKPPIRPSTILMMLFFILDYGYDTPYSNPISISSLPFFINSPLPLPWRLICMGICWNCKFPLTLPLRNARSSGIILSPLLAEERRTSDTPKHPKLSPIVE